MCRALLALLVGAGLHADDAADLARAAKSPYDFVEYINTRTNLDWSALKQWMPPDAYLDQCQRQQFCSAELIEVPQPRQVIVLAHFLLDMYFRFVPEGENWRLRGTLRSSNRRVAEYRHEVKMFGSKPFLIVTVEGAYGSDMGENREAWLDLTRPTFEPVFFNSVEAWSSGATHISTSYETSVASLETSPVETIRLTRRVEFGAPCTRESLGEKVYTLVFIRVPSGKFEFDDKRTTLPRAVRGLGNIHHQPLFPLEEYMRTHFAELKTILRGPDSDDKACFKYVVGVCSSGATCRALKALIPK